MQLRVLKHHWLGSSGLHTDISVDQDGDYLAVEVFPNEQSRILRIPRYFLLRKMSGGVTAVRI